MGSESWIELESPASRPNQPQSWNHSPSWAEPGGCCAGFGDGSFHFQEPPRRARRQRSTVASGPHANGQGFLCPPRPPDGLLLLSGRPMIMRAGRTTRGLRIVRAIQPAPGHHLPRRCKQREGVREVHLRALCSPWVVGIDYGRWVILAWSPEEAGGDNSSSVTHVTTIAGCGPDGVNSPRALTHSHAPETPLPGGFTGRLCWGTDGHARRFPPCPLKR